LEREDNERIAYIIRHCLELEDCAIAGTAYTDASTDDLYTLFNKTPGGSYFVVEKIEGLNKSVVGGAGYMHTKGLPPYVCELCRVFVLPEVRGHGLGRRLVSLCNSSAKERDGYTKMYLESLSKLNVAIKLYESMGFEHIPPLIASEHTACNVFMSKDL
jgi:putative acetyltransferase